MASLNLSQYRLTFDDEFNSFSRDINGSGTGTWDTSFGPGIVRNLGQGEQEIYVEPEYKGLGINPFSDQNGVLTITANKANPSQVSALGGYQYTSGMITTQKTWSQEYGYFEIRAKLPAGQGLWPAFWMLPVSNSTGAEIDVFEQLGNNPNVVHQSVHDPNAGGAGQMFDAPVNSSGGYHTYGVMWTPTTMTFYVDGQETGERANTINQPMYLIANLALGGNWGGPVNSTTPFPSQMKIDYIRAYSPTPPPPAASGSTLFSPSTTPGTVTDPDGNAVELGVKFQASTGGTITGIRFYKGPQNTGVHVADLWDANGHLLATGTFANETASGWQQVNFASPVTINAGQTYIAAYHTNTGHYSVDEGFFNNAYSNGPLTAPSSGSSGGNGVYAYGATDAFPTKTYAASNYYVDPIFYSKSAADPTITDSTGHVASLPVIASGSQTFATASTGLAAPVTESVSGGVVTVSTPTGGPDKTIDLTDADGGSYRIQKFLDVKASLSGATRGSLVVDGAERVSITLGEGNYAVHLQNDSSVVNHLTWNDVSFNGAADIINFGTGNADVWGGKEADTFAFHAGDGLATVETFSALKGDVLEIDHTLKSAMTQTSTSGSTLISFGDPNHGVLLHGVTGLAPTGIHWI